MHFGSIKRRLQASRSSGQSTTDLRAKERMSAQRSLTAFGTWYRVATCRRQISEKEGREGLRIGELESGTVDREGCGRGAFLLPLENTRLSIACKEGHTEIVELLLKHGADVNVINKYGDTPLSRACLKGHTEIVKLLLNADGININHKAADNRHTEIVEALLKHGADVNVSNKYG
uniref:Uncharacterized protein n=1 Tax=Amphimedon queenslandica TaxID=400682 RepID=A0A1X7SKV0_AMPQE